MNDRRSYVTNRPRENRPTARTSIVSALTAEILASSSEEPFLLGSEYQLCRRFKVSRVTVRLALDDLENHGLVFRKHGVGTYAHGKSSRVQRHMAVLVDLTAIRQSEPLGEFLAGVHAYAKQQGAAVLFTDHPSEEWRPELASILSGVIIVSDEVSPKTSTNLRDRKIPHLIIGKSGMPTKIEGLSAGLENAKALDNLTEDFFEAGQLAAKLVMNAFFRLGPLLTPPSL